MINLLDPEQEEQYARKPMLLKQQVLALGNNEAICITQESRARKISNLLVLPWQELYRNILLMLRNIGKVL